MKILFHLGHPAHFHLLKNTISDLIQSDNQVSILIKKKDVLEELLRSSGFEYHNILPQGRKDNMFGIALGQIKQDFQLLSFCLRHRQDILAGTSVSISHVGKILNIPSINMTEDDAAIVLKYARLTYPWATKILAPDVCNLGKWEHKTIHYNSYHELAYLHPNHFSPDEQIAKKYVDINKPYVILRFAKLGAHHDNGIIGISDDEAARLIKIISPYAAVIITSERALNSNLEPYRKAIIPSDMHHLMAYATLFIGDSQTMSAEAGVLGIPFVRYNNFVGKIGYLNDLENNYHLGTGITPPNILLLEKTCVDYLKNNRKEICIKNRKKLLRDKIDYSQFLTNFFSKYPIKNSISK